MEKAYFSSQDSGLNIQNAFKTGSLPNLKPLPELSKVNEYVFVSPIWHKNSQNARARRQTTFQASSCATKTTSINFSYAKTNLVLLLQICSV